MSQKFDLGEIHFFGLLTYLYIYYMKKHLEENKKPTIKTCNNEKNF